MTAERFTHPYGSHSRGPKFWSAEARDGESKCLMIVATRGLGGTEGPIPTRRRPQDDSTCERKVNPQITDGSLELRTFARMDL